ncbi:MAG: twin-arginine translocase subunit TatB [Dehalococcoidales bacterium]|nr:MAG: twin-arginine translocase subunit TatB [Dehalococcoidales bacterium]
MNFLDMGIMEILLVLVVALIIWGPGKIPEIARNLGKFMNAMKKMSYDLTTQVKKELELEEKGSGSSPDTTEKSGKKAESATEDKEKPENKQQ